MTTRSRSAAGEGGDSSLQEITALVWVYNPSYHHTPRHSATTQKVVLTSTKAKSSGLTLNLVYGPDRLQTEPVELTDQLEDSQNLLTMYSMSNILFYHWRKVSGKWRKTKQNKGIPLRKPENGANIHVSRLITFTFMVVNGRCRYPERITKVLWNLWINTFWYWFTRSHTKNIVSLKKKFEIKNWVWEQS